jgi:hypothetical protein
VAKIEKKDNRIATKSQNLLHCCIVIGVLTLFRIVAMSHIRVPVAQGNEKNQHLKPLYFSY